MLRAVLLLSALAGLHARPLQKNALQQQNGAWMIRAPQLVQDEYMDSHAHAEHRRLDRVPSRRLIMALNNGLHKEHSSEMGKRILESESQWEVVLAAENEAKVQDNPNQKAAPIEDRRQGTEPSRRFLVDLNTGMLKEHSSEMNRRVSGFYNYPSNYEFRQGTENSHRTLVDIRTGLELGHLSEMERRAIPFYEFRQGTEYSPATLMELRRALMRRDIERAKVSKDGTDATDTSHKAVPPELRRQGTEPSRRFLVDLNTGMLKEQSSEMDRRVSGFYNYPSNYEFRQGTENSHRTLVDIRTGLELAHLSEMERRAIPFYEFRQGTEYSPATLMELRRALMRRDIERAKVSKDETDATDTSHMAVPLELRRQGTEPSRRFLVDLNTGMLKEHSSEMDRRVSGFYNYPSNYEFRQGTENSHRTLVDIRTGLELGHLSEMERRAIPFYEFRQGTEYSPAKLMELRRELMMRNMERAKVSKDETDATDTSHKAVPYEFQRQGTEPSRRFLIDMNTGMLKEHSSEMDRRVSGLSEQGTKYSQDISNELQNNHVLETYKSKVNVPQHLQTIALHKALENNEVNVEEIKSDVEYSHANIIDNRIMVKEPEGVATCQGEVIDGKCYHFNPDLLTFSEAEASCKRLSSLGHLASITSADLHARLVAMVTRAKSDRVLTWLGGIMKNNRFEWIDGSAWGYSDWMPGHPRTLERKQFCVEMFKMDESWWTAVNCGLKRASLCSYPVVA